MKNRQKKIVSRKILSVISVFGALTMLGTSLVSNVYAVSDNGGSILDALGIPGTSYEAAPTFYGKCAPDVQISAGDDFVLTPEIYFDIDDSADAQDIRIEQTEQIDRTEQTEQNAENTDITADNTPETPVTEADAVTCTEEYTETAKEQDDLYWLSRIIYAESRGESMEGKIAVGNVVLNRVRCDSYPDTVYGVIFDTECGIQFTPAANGSIYNEPDADCIEAAKRCLEGESVSLEIIYFINPSLASDTWVSDNRNYVVTIGNHEFYS